jgi:hypothetical protein
MGIVQIIFMCRKQQNNHVNSTHLYRIVNVTWKLLTSITIKQIITPQYVFVTCEKETPQPVFHIRVPSTTPRNGIRLGSLGGKQICEFSYKLVFNRMDQDGRPLCTRVFERGYLRSEQRGPGSVHRQST